MIPSINNYFDRKCFFDFREPDDLVVRIHNAIARCTQAQVTLDETRELVRVANEYRSKAPYVVDRFTCGSLARTIFITPEGRPFVLMTRCKFQKDQCLGQGSFKKVKYAIDLETGDVAAVAISRQLRYDQKLDPNWSARTWPRAQRECEIMQMCAKVGAVRLLGSTTWFAEEFGKHYMVMEFCEKGSLEESIRDRSLSFEQKSCIAFSLIEHVNGIHSLGFVHCDLKPGNIFLKEDNTCRIGDFGLSKRVGECYGGGSAPYMAPEIIKHRLNTQASDAWALGLILYKLFHPKRKLLVLAVDKESLLMRIQALTEEEVEKKIAELSPECPQLIRSVIAGLLQVDPTRRMTLKEAYKTSLSAKMDEAPLDAQDGV